MFYYRPSSRSQDYTPYLPRRSYRPASFDLNDVPSSAFPFEDLGYPSLPHPFLPPRVDAETRYRHALDELQAAEQEFEAHIALERARQAAAVRQRAAVEAARFRRVDALYAEIERIKRERALQVQAEEVLAQRERTLRAPTGFDRAHRGGRALLRALVNDHAEGVPAEAAFGPTRCGGDGFLRALVGDGAERVPVQGAFDRADHGGGALLRALVGDGAEGVPVQGAFDRADRGGGALLRALIGDGAEGVPVRADRVGRGVLRALVHDQDTVPRLFEGRPSCSEPTHSRTRHDNVPTTLGDVLGLVLGRPEPELGNQPQRPTSATPSQVRQPAEPEAESGWVKEHDGEATWRTLQKLVHDIASQETALEVRLSVRSVSIQSSK